MCLNPFQRVDEVKNLLTYLIQIAKKQIKIPYKWRIIEENSATVWKKKKNIQKRKTATKNVVKWCIFIIKH